MFKKESPVLEWKDVDPKDEAAAKAISAKLDLGDIYFSFNVPLQIWITYNVEDQPRSGINLEESQVLNYMPRKESCEMQSLADIFSADAKVTPEDIKEFMRISALVMKNLARQMEKFNPLDLKKNLVYYPNSSDE